MIAPPTHNSQSQGDSDSDWDDDDDFASKKITIKIKPVAQVTPSKISASVDELRATVGTWKSLASVNLVKPNSRRHHQSTVNLNNGLESRGPVLGSTKSTAALPVGPLLPEREPDWANPSPNGILQPIPPAQFTIDCVLPQSYDKLCISNGGERLPVAFSIQESISLNGQTGTLLIGSLKMAVPPSVLDHSTQLNDQKLEFSIQTLRPWTETRLNSAFIQEMEDSSVKDPIKRTFLVDMSAVQSHVKATNQKQTCTKYHLLPELLKYAILVPNDGDKQTAIGGTATLIGPLCGVSHWLCDNDETKVKIDLRFLEEVNPAISMNDINNLTVSVQVNGGVVSHQCRPDAKWDPLDSRLTWTFGSIAELIRAQSFTGAPSCLARFNLSDGPSVPSDMSMQFSIVGKTISGAHVLLNSNQNFRLAKQKLEVRVANHGRA